MKWFLLVGCLELITQAPDREFDRSIMNILTKLSMKYCL
jgi:hypothetical protein